MLFLGVLQLALTVHVRNTLIDCAAEGARYGGLSDRTPTQGAERTRALIRSALGPAYARDVTATTTTVDDLPVVEVRVRASLPVVGLIAGSRRLEVSGHGLVEMAVRTR